MIRRQLRVVTNATRRTVGTAVRVARRRPVLAAAVVAVVIAVIALLVWLVKGRRRKNRENWQFDEPGKELTPTTLGSKGQNHWNQIKAFCARGMTWKQITSDDSKKWMAKYNGDQAFEACKAGLADLSNNVKGKGDGGWAGDSTGNCNFTCESKNRKACTNTLLRGTHPCFNSGSTKCCDPCGKNCVDASGDNTAYNYKPGGGTSSGTTTPSGGGTKPKGSDFPGREIGGDGLPKSSPDTDYHTADDSYVWLYDKTEGEHGAGDSFRIWSKNKGYNLRSTDPRWENKTSAIWIPPYRKVTLYENMPNTDSVFVDNIDSIAQSNWQILGVSDKGRWVRLTKYKLGDSRNKSWDNELSGIKVEWASSGAEQSGFYKR